jgi:superfamily II DNA or RNA helicase
MIDLRIRKKNFFLIYSYDSLKNDIKEIERLRTITFDTIVIDEAHYI